MCLCDGHRNKNKTRNIFSLAAIYRSFHYTPRFCYCYLCCDDRGCCLLLVFFSIYFYYCLFELQWKINNRKNHQPVEKQVQNEQKINSSNKVFKLVLWWNGWETRPADTQHNASQCAKTQSSIWACSKWSCCYISSCDICLSASAINDKWNSNDEVRWNERKRTHSWNEITVANMFWASRAL